MRDFVKQQDWQADTKHQVVGGFYKVCFENADTPQHKAQGHHQENRQYGRKYVQHMRPSSNVVIRVSGRSEGIKKKPVNPETLC